ncbi:hypothetical protein GH714_026465 [Hevea brasiliensis]|uniref:Uncharacterized protein n=1 Tax=Hevea brasiliensis TaxID=3981 RepID=A0A6A6MIA3_HEVBR|nr:hypothetical protein GH714_026465 [Hevea brasiliensis]
MGESDMVDVPGNQAEGSQNSNGDKSTYLAVGKDEYQSAVQENCGNQSTSGKQADLRSMATDECSKKVEAVSKAEPCNVITEGAACYEFRIKDEHLGLRREDVYLLN